jgi:hypothetical protein
MIEHWFKPLHHVAVGSVRDNPAHTRQWGCLAPRQPGQSGPDVGERRASDERGHRYQTCRGERKSDQDLPNLGQARREGAITPAGGYAKSWQIAFLRPWTNAQSFISCPPVAGSSSMGCCSTRAMAPLSGTPSADRRDRGRGNRARGEGMLEALIYPDHAEP